MALGRLRRGSFERVTLAVVAAAVLASTGLASTSLVAQADPAVDAGVDPTPWQLRVPSPGEDSNLPAAWFASLRFPTRDPRGADDWSCRPSAEHPEPVILIHGTLDNAFDNWNGLSPILKDQGYCVFALNYGHSTGVAHIFGTGDMVAAAHEVAAFVDRVVEVTGAEHVALVGHSQGGSQARYVANRLLPPGLVDKVIALNPTNHPTTLSGLIVLADVLHLKPWVFRWLDDRGLPALPQQASPDAPFFADLNAGPETVPGIAYTVIATRFDEIMTPYPQAFLKSAPGTTVDNILIQDVCPGDWSDHLSTSYSKNVAQIVLNKLDPDHPHAIACHVQLPLVGSTAHEPRWATAGRALWRWLTSTWS